jgi:hypothetical protein
MFGQTPKMEIVVSTSENVDGIKVTSKNTNPSSLNYSIYGLNKSTTYNGIGVYGGHEGNGTGVYGWSKNGHGVSGFSQFSTFGSGVYGLVYGVGKSGVRGYSENGYGNGVLGEAESGIGVKGYALNFSSTTGIGGHFSNASSTGYALITGTGKVGIGTETPGTKMDVVVGATENIEGIRAVLNKTDPTNYYSAITGTNKATNNVGNGIYGAHDGSGNGVYGWSNKGHGVFGFSQFSTGGSGVYGLVYGFDRSGVRGYSENGYGNGVLGEAESGIGVKGYSLSNSNIKPGIGGHFSNSLATGYALITGTGLVGIGTETPAAKLDIKGTSYLSHFYYDTSEDTYIRGGKAGSKVLINDITGMGSVGIGLANPNEILDVNGRIRIRHNGITSGLWFSNSTNSLNGVDGAFYGMKTDTETGFYIGNAWRFWVNNLGNATLTGTLTQSSDKRLKKDISPLKNSLVSINKLNGYQYKWIEESRSKDLQTGLIAQEVQKIFPELVQTDEKGFLSVNYIGLVPHLIEAVKELKDENNSLKNQNQALESRLGKIEAMLSSIKPNTEKCNSQK